MKKNKLLILFYSLIPSILSPSASAFIIPPGAPVTDGPHILEKIRQFIQDQTIAEGRQSIITKQVGQSLGLVTNESTMDSKKNILEQGQKTQVDTDLYNKKITQDLQPNYSDACSILIANKYASNYSKEKASKNISEAFSSISKSSLDGTGLSEKNKKMLLYDQMLDSQKTDINFLSPQQWTGKKTIDATSARNAILAVDTISYTDGIFYNSLSDERTDLYKTVYFDNARASLMLNINKYVMLDPIYSRMGGASKDLTGIDSNYNNEDYSNQISNDLKSNNNYKETGKINLPTDIKSTNKRIEDGKSSKDMSKEKYLEQFLIAPLPTTYITSRFQPSRTLGGLTRKHNGVDFRGATGTPIYAAQSGVIGPAGWQSSDHGQGYGLRTYIMHDKNIVTVYGHMSQLNVRTGQKVAKGDVIGYVGNSGRSFGSHLHFGISTNGSYSSNANWIDPMSISGTSAVDALDQATNDISGNNNGTQQSYDGYEDASGNAYKNNNSNNPQEIKSISQVRRQELLMKGLGLNQDWEDFKQLEQMKFALSIKILNKINGK